MHYLQDGQWVESREVIEAVPGGAVARYGPHKSIFNSNLNAPEGGVDLLTPDQKRLRFSALGLRWRNLATDETVWIAALKDCAGVLEPPNRVRWDGAFEVVDFGAMRMVMSVAFAAPADEDRARSAASRAVRKRWSTEEGPQPRLIERLDYAALVALSDGLPRQAFRNAPVRRSSAVAIASNARIGETAPTKLAAGRSPTRATVIDFDLVVPTPSMTFATDHTYKI